MTKPPKLFVKIIILFIIALVILPVLGFLLWTLQPYYRNTVGIINSNYLIHTSWDGEVGIYKYNDCKNSMPSILNVEFNSSYIATIDNHYLFVQNNYVHRPENKQEYSTPGYFIFDLKLSQFKKVSLNDFKDEIYKVENLGEKVRFQKPKKFLSVTQHQFSKMDNIELCL
ncbi:hypothetical protein [Ostreibacterium oceani]|uniref:Uncharacterized protein n=1 Tax=Ostreibacterium oceani TaxID=2654998 RepID=A0A6N7EW60_9GAMM|nr:hypothetical protein [Ostreibacterium oceani]MPV85825.1 hypothetical protein [Ostreibacterium oceani]